MANRLAADESEYLISRGDRLSDYDHCTLILCLQQCYFMLIAIKLLHTVIWAMLAGCILALPFLAVLRRFRWAAIITVLVLFECAVLAFNAGTCPLTNWAARYTTDRASNFDIYLPNCLAERNKSIFGTVFVLGEIVVVACWSTRRLSTPTQIHRLYGADRPDDDHTSA